MKKSPEKLVKVSLYITEKQKAAIEALSEETGAAWSWYVRRGIDLAVEKHGKPKGRR